MTSKGGLHETAAEFGPYAVLILALMTALNPAIGISLGASLAAPMVAQSWTHCSQGIFGRRTPQVRLLQQALRDALANALDCLERHWQETAEGNAELIAAGFGNTRSKEIFAKLETDLAARLSDEHLAVLALDPGWLTQLEQRAPEAQESIDAYLAEVVGTVPDARLAAFLRTEFALEVAYQFGTILYGRGTQSQSVRDAFTILLAEATFGTVTSLDKKLERLTHEQTRSDEERAQQLRNQIHASEERIVSVLEEMNERLVAQSRSAPPIRSRIWDIPHHWNPYFMGRESLLARIHDRFAANTHPVALVQAIQGLGGVGKTQVAVHYAYRYSAEYTGVWWLPAESAATLAARYAALADRLELRVAESGDQKQRIEAVRNYLEGTEETGERWLLIFDNAVPTFDSHSGAGALDGYRPRRGNCDVLITSREKSWPLAEEQDVDVLAEDDAVQFLMERTGDEDERAARVLALELGCLPLALEQAGAYIYESRRQQSLASYLALFRRNPLEHLASDRTKVGEYNEVVATTWFISFEAIEHQTPAAGDLLRLCAFLYPERIPIGDLIEHADKLPSDLGRALRDVEAGPSAISLLLRYSLAEAAGSGLLNVHRLVQLVVREWLTDEERTTWVLVALAIIDAAFPTNVDDPQQWEVCAQLVAHAHTCVQHAALSVGESADIGRLLTKTGMYLQQRALYLQSTIDLQWALKIVETNQGFHVSDVASALNNLAGVLRSQSDLLGARKLLDRALMLLETLGEQNIPVMATTLNDLGNVMRAQGDLVGAEGRLKRSLAIHEQVFGANHPRVAAVLTNLGNVLWYQGRLAEARPLLQRALKIDEMAYGHDHPKVAVDLANLATVLRAEGDPTQARRMLERALAIDEAVYKYDHPNVAIVLAGLAWVARAEDDFDEAELLFRKALRINEAVYDANHSEVATNLNHLAGLLRERGKLGQATALFERVLGIAELTLKPDDPALAQAYWNLAVVMADQGNLTRANALFERAAELGNDAAG
jgi:tetratricopeptide (TPR) repeat protein